MEVRLCLIILISAFTILLSAQEKFLLRPGHNLTSGDSMDNNKKTSDKRSGENSQKEHSSKHDKNSIGLETMFGSSTSRYQYRKTKDFNAKGKSRSRGIGKYGKMSSASTEFVIEGKIGKYGRRKPMKSKFKTRGREKKYSRKINDNRFDIKGDLYAQHQHEGIGDYQANGSYTTLKLKTKERKGNSNGNKFDSESNSHENNSIRQETTWFA
uniref:SJCHGC06609 protein n=1 Tax=Schistosoma japonicum TaxID=6182 RepID=Q5DGB9_SCHJA|nr:SJCHGC06609 protein [Schistosoma japonicum]